MKQWKIFLGVKWDLDNPDYKSGRFVTESNMLNREKWTTIGRGREKIVIDENGKYWTFEVKNSLGADGLFVIEFEVKKSQRQ